MPNGPRGKCAVQLGNLKEQCQNTLNFSNRTRNLLLVWIWKLSHHQISSHGCDWFGNCNWPKKIAVFLRKLRGTVSSVGSREYSAHNTKTENKTKCNELTKANNQTKNLTFLKCSSLSISDLQSISGNTSSMRKEAGDLGLGKNETTINETESYEAQVICPRPYKVAKLDCLMNNHSSN